MKKLRVGILGLGRAGAFIKSLYLNDAVFVATCETQAEMNYGLKELYGEDFGFYTDFEEFLKHPGGLDVVILGNFFHEHAHYAIRCLEEGIHVISECLSNATMAEGVALVRAAEKSKAMYIYGENYPYYPTYIEADKVYKGGTLGKVLFAESEYNHPLLLPLAEAEKMTTYYLRKFEKHWRNYLPRTYYIQHSLAPLMFVTGSTPKTVTAFPSYNDGMEMGDQLTGPNVKDRAAIVLTQNDDHSVFRVTGMASFGAEDISFRFCCDKGQIENIRGMDDHIMLRYDAGCVPGKEPKYFYKPEITPEEAELVKKAGGGHEGADFRTIREALKYIREGKQYPMDVYFATTVSSVAIQAHRSVIAGGQPFEIPDFHDEEVRKKYENDHDTPFWGSDGSAPTMPCSSH
ncbi:MAG: Gfo/Idh/MocA family oxidoreductase [Clostridia bacterium]|nr:Gfo/Idh/MocA family oxidoreductase [Clostridia bacterium]